VNIPLVSFPQSPLLQTWMFAVPQTTTPQSVAATTFLEQLQMATLLTVKFRQPSHEFTFGVGMTFISYPLVLTPLV
jgi:hypothetical protein